MLKVSVVAGASFEEAVTVFLTKPLPAVGEPFASSSAWVNVCVAVHVIEAAGARVVPGHARSSLSLSSDRLIPVRLVLPVFVTRYE